MRAPLCRSGAAARARICCALHCCRTRTASMATAKSCCPDMTPRSAPPCKAGAGARLWHAARGQHKAASKERCRHGGGGDGPRERDIEQVGAAADEAFDLGHGAECADVAVGNKQRRPQLHLRARRSPQRRNARDATAQANMRVMTQHARLQAAFCVRLGIGTVEGYVAHALQPGQHCVPPIAGC